MTSSHPDLLSTLPPELLFEMCIRFLQPKDILRLSQVSKWLNQGICCDEILWKYLYQRNLSQVQLPKDGGYRQAYRQAYQRISQQVQTEKPEDRKRIPLIEAIKDGYEQLVDTWINHDSDSADFWRDREFALQIAAIYNQRHIMERLLQRTAHNQNSTTWAAIDYDSPMNQAAHNGRLDIVELMISLGATDYGEAMAFAAEGGHRTIIERMIELGATHYRLSMICAAKRGQRAIVEWMLELGTGPQRRWTPIDRDYETAIERATENKHVDMVEFIRSHQAQHN
jgi:ankyrin repeat protein